MEAREAMQLCIKEIEIVQSNIARYDQNGMTIKSWCITLWSAVVAYSIQTDNPQIAIIGLIVVLGFGFNELIYRSFQGRFIQRSGDIERLLKAGDLTAYQFSLNAAAGRPLKNEMWKALTRPHFWVFYLMFMLVSAGVIFYIRS